MSDFQDVTPAPPTPTKPYKAITAFVIALIGSFIATVQGRTDLDTMGWVDWLIVLGTAIVAAGGVYQVTNPAQTR